MSQHLRVTIWIPTLLTLAFALINPLLEAIQKELPPPLRYTSYALALLCFFWQYTLAMSLSVANRNHKAEEAKEVLQNQMRELGLSAATVATVPVELAEMAEAQKPLGKAHRP